MPEQFHQRGLSGTVGTDYPSDTERSDRDLDRLAGLKISEIFVERKLHAKNIVKTIDNVNENAYILYRNSKEVQNGNE